MTHSINESINDEAIYRTAPATPGLLITTKHNIICFYNRGFCIKN